MKTDTNKNNSSRSGKELSGYFKKRLSQFIEPLFLSLDALIDIRLVRTLEATVVAIIRHRHRQNGLLLSELGEYLAGPDHAPAGTKRLSNLLRSPKWGSSEIMEFLLCKSVLLAQNWRHEGRRPVLLYDDGVVEKPESLRAEGLCAVRSSKSKRLTRIKPGYYTPPLHGTVHVPGIQWMCVLLATLGKPPQLARMLWWTNRGDHATDGRTEREGLFRQMCATFFDAVHVFDRGYAGAPWLGTLLGQNAHFVMRWHSSYFLQDEKGARKKAWQLTKGKKTMGGKLVWDAVRKKQRQLKMLYVRVFHPDFPGKALSLVVSRPGKAMAPWYLLTNLPIEKLRDAWFVVHAYAKRWDIEIAFRFCKSELGLESPRLWFWENRLKFMQIIALVFAFLLAICHSTPQALRIILLNVWAKRTGERCRNAALPLYRLRSALSHLFNRQVSQNSG